MRFGALDQPVVAGSPDFEKALDIDHARDGGGDDRLWHERRAAAAPQRLSLRLIVPGWYSTYWVKMLNSF